MLSSISWLHRKTNRGGIVRITDNRKSTDARELVEVIKTPPRRCNASCLRSHAWSRAHASRPGWRRRGRGLSDGKRGRWRRRLSVPRKLRSGIEDMTKLVSLFDVLIVIGGDDGFQDTGILVVVIHPVDSVLEAPIRVAECSKNQRDFLGTAGDVVGGIVRVLDR
jgi:hypothetical protein